MKIVIWGTGYIANNYMEQKCYHTDDNKIIAFVDNDKRKWGDFFHNIQIISPNNINELSFDCLIICTNCFDEIMLQIDRDMSNIRDKVITYYDVEENKKRELIAKYRDSTDTEIQKILDYYMKNPLNIFGYYRDERDVLYPVMYDVDGMPYILFEEKQMFFPKTYKFMSIDDCEYVKNILYEQGRHSPHLYIKSEEVIKKDMVIVDAGTCEGNFALRYVEEAKKVYLIESNPAWVEVLKKTFAPYKDKVVICDKYLAGADTETTITLDTLITGKVDLLKMDIEGNEVEALKGGKRVLKESSAYCAVCSYHRHSDEQEIKQLLERYGYRTSTSEGYMFFPYDTVTEFRRGVMYGYKNDIE